MRRVSGAGILTALRPSRIVGLLLMTLVLTVQVLLGDDENVPWRHDWWDQLHSWAPRDRGAPQESPVVIVAIDSETMLTNGAWPWPRDKLAELVNRIAALDAAVIAFDIILSNPDPQSPLAMAEEYRAYGRHEAAAALEAVGDTDAFFASILRDGFRDQDGQMLVRAAAGLGSAYHRTARVRISGVGSGGRPRRSAGVRFSHPARAGGLPRKNPGWTSSCHSQPPPPVEPPPPGFHTTPSP